MSQNAYYHLAECYLKVDKKQEALNAFRNASQMEFSAEIEKDALLNYALLSYEIGNPYEPVPTVLTAYLKKYPKDQQQTRIQELLVDSYVTSKNFKGALILLDQNRGYASKEVYQKVAFYRGVELFLDTDYQGSLDHFTKAVSQRENSSFTARSQYWKAESEYVLGNYTEALKSYTLFKNNAVSKNEAESAILPYNLGYTHYKLKQYTEAASFFKEYTEQANADPKRVGDAFMRLGDSYFVSSKYWPALDAYNKVLGMKTGAKDYASYQKALGYGFLDRVDNKIKELQGFSAKYPNSRLKPRALFELGNTYIKQGKTASGIKVYNRIIAQYKKKPIAAKALLRKGLTQYNNNKNEAALIVFKQLVKEHPGSQEAIQGVASAKLVYVDLGRVQEYGTWVKGLDFVEVSDTELDNATYESANKHWLEGNDTAAIKGFKGYLSQFMNGLHTIEVSFNLAQLYFKGANKEAALPHYKYVALRDSEYTEQSLARICEIYIGKENYTEALPFLLRLEKEAIIDQNISFAQSNLMKGYYAQKQYAKTLSYADKVLAKENLDNRIKSDAYVMIARSAIKTNNEDKAKEAYTQVQKFGTGALAAEALYYDAFFNHESRDYEASNQSVQLLAKEYASYKKWGAKGLVLMAKNFYALEDAFQATYILENVIKNFTSYPDLVNEAKAELAIIKAKEAKTNASVNPNEN